jgi:hypothetical protein
MFSRFEQREQQRELDGLSLRDSIPVNNIHFIDLLNWTVKEKKGTLKVHQWKPTGRFDDVTGKEKHNHFTHEISWFFTDLRGVLHVGTKSTHYRLRLKNKYTPRDGTSFPTQSNDKIMGLLKKFCRSALQGDDDSSDSSESKDYTVPHFKPSMAFIEGLEVEEPDEWKLYYDKSRRTTFLIGAETIELYWHYKHNRQHYVGNKTHRFCLKRSKRASYYDSARRRFALQDDVDIKVALAVLERAV